MTSMTDQTAHPQHLAPVFRITDHRPAELRYRIHREEPPRTQPVDHFGWAVEQQLVRLCDAGESPFLLLTVFSDRAVKAEPLLANLFAAADAVVDGEPGVPGYVLADEYADALYELCACLRGAA